MQKSLKKVKKIANYKCIQFAQLFMSRYSAHLLLDIYPSALVLNRVGKGHRVDPVNLSSREEEF